MPSTKYKPAVIAFQEAIWNIVDITDLDEYKNSFHDQVIQIREIAEEVYNKHAIPTPVLTAKPLPKGGNHG